MEFHHFNPPFRKRPRSRFIVRKSSFLFVLQIESKIFVKSTVKKHIEKSEFNIGVNIRIVRTDISPLYANFQIPLFSVIGSN